jgi:hypothetical protein
MRRTVVRDLLVVLDRHFVEVRSRSRWSSGRRRGSSNWMSINGDNPTKIFSERVGLRTSAIF